MRGLNSEGGPAVVQTKWTMAWQDAECGSGNAECGMRKGIRNAEKYSSRFALRVPGLTMGLRRTPCHHRATRNA